MSKCREEFIKYQDHTPEQLPCEWSDWLVCWNTRGKVDAEICRHPGYIEDQEQYYGNLMAEAIEQENEK